MRHRLKLKVFDKLNSGGKPDDKLSDSYIPSTFTNYNHQNRKDGDDTLLHSKSTYFYRWYQENKSQVKPAQNGFRLLNTATLGTLALVAGISVNLSFCNQDVYADSLSLSLTTNPDETGATNVADRSEVQYREYGFNVNYSDLKGNTYYHIFVSTEDIHDGQLFNEDFPTFRINGVGNNVKPIDGFDDNTWGYNLTKESTATEELAYNTVPTASSNPEAVTYRTSKNENNSGNDSFRLNFAAKFGDDAPKGLYKSNVYLSVVMDPSSATLNGITTMQEMTNNICKNAEENDTKRLMDTRDGKLYWVAKLKDGNCWMTQNLDFDIPEGDGTLSSEDTNVSGVITTDTTKITSIEDWNENNNSDTSSVGIRRYRAYYDPEVNQKLYYIGTNKNHTQGVACGTNSIAVSISECLDGGQLATSGDEHYRLGNFYSWSATTLGSGDDFINDSDRGKDAAYSICPRGWKLPSSGAYSSGANGSFQYLLSQYGFDGKPTSDNYAIYDSPFYLIYGGSVRHVKNNDIDSGRMLSLGFGGYYWTSTAYHAIQTLFLYLYTNALNDGTNNERYHGFQVRCVNDSNV